MFHIRIEIYKTKCYQVVTVCDEVEELVERVRALRDDLGLKIAEQDFLGKLEKLNSVNKNSHTGNQYSIPKHRSNNLILIGRLYNIICSII